MPNYVLLPNDSDTMRACDVETNPEFSHEGTGVILPDGTGIFISRELIEDLYAELVTKNQLPNKKT